MDKPAPIGGTRLLGVRAYWGYAHGHLGKDNSSDSLAAFGNYVPFLNRVMKENPHFSEKLNGCGKFNQKLLHFQHLAFGLK